jgi:hypothetical protein
MSGYEPAEPDPRDREVLALLQRRDGSLTEVLLIDGRGLRVWNIAWGYDAGASWAHITTNISPDAEGEAVDFFFTHEVEAIRAPDLGLVLLSPISPSS